MLFLFYSLVEVAIVVFAGVDVKKEPFVTDCDPFLAFRLSGSNATLE